MCSAMVVLFIIGCSGGGSTSASERQQNDKTLLGVVTNPHGIRDDVAETLQKKFGSDPEKLEASILYARALQGMLVSVQSNRTIDQSYMDQRGVAMDCFAMRMGAKDFVAESREIEAMTYNTPERFKALNEFGKRANGLIIRATMDKNVCEKAKQ